MSDVIIVYGGLGIAMLRAALIHEIMAQELSRRRLEDELRRALARMRTPVPLEGVLATSSRGSRSARWTAAWAARR